jgi:hypothetical protein
MKANFVFLLAALTTTALFFPLDFLIHLGQQPIQVEIRSTKDVQEIITAIESLHRSDVDIVTEGNFGLKSIDWIGGVLGMWFVTALTVIFYKVYCRWFKISASL